MVDPSTAPKEGSVVIKELKKVAKPSNFVAPTPKKSVSAVIGGLNVLPSISSYTRPAKPIIIYEFESSSECRKVREACTVLDLIVEYRPCPGTYASERNLKD